MFNASGHLGDYFNGFFTKSCLTVNLNTFQLPLFTSAEIQWDTGKFSCEMMEEAEDKRPRSK